MGSRDGEPGTRCGGACGAADGGSMCWRAPAGLADASLRRQQGVDGGQCVVAAVRRRLHREKPRARRRVWRVLRGTTSLRSWWPSGWHDAVPLLHATKGPPEHQEFSGFFRAASLVEVVISHPDRGRRRGVSRRCFEAPAAKRRARSPSDCFTTSQCLHDEVGVQRHGFRFAPEHCRTRCLRQVFRLNAREPRGYSH